MAKNVNNYINIPSLLICGAGIGILLGLSASPVLNIIVGSVIALVGGIIGGLSGLKSDSDAPRRRSSVSALPLATLVIGLVVGSLLGIYIRNYDLLAPSPQQFANKWAGTDLPSNQLQKRLFENLYPSQQPEQTIEETVNDSEKSPVSNDDKSLSNRADTLKRETDKNTVKKTAPSSSDKKSIQSSTFLYSLTTEQCARLEQSNPEELLTDLKFEITTSSGRKEIEKCSDNFECLDKIRKKICPNSK